MWLLALVLLNCYLFVYLPWGLPLYIHIPFLLFVIIYRPKKSNYFKSLPFWGYIFNICLDVPDNINLKKHKYIFAIHPHGLFSISHSLYFAYNPNMLDVVPVAHTVMFWIPILGHMLSLCGAIQATKKEITRVLKEGKSISISSGGLREMKGLTNHNIIAPRIGLINIAKKTKTDITPVWVDGEDKLYDIYIWSQPIQQKLLSMFYYPGIVIAIGRPWLPFFPKKQKLTVKFGEPINFKNLNQKEFLLNINRLKRL